MRYVKWILGGLAVIIGYKVYLRVQAKSTVQSKGAATTADNRQPGMIANLLDDVKGVFNFGPNPSVPTIAGAYGFVGVQAPTGDDGYVSVDSDTRVPTFLEGATGGVQDPAMEGTAPPPVLGPPPAGGSGAYYSPQGGGNKRNYLAAGGRGKQTLTNTNPTDKRKTGAKPSKVGGGGNVDPKRTDPQYLQ